MAEIQRIHQRTREGTVVGKIIRDAFGNVFEITLQFIDDTEGPTFRLNYHPKKHGRAAILHVHLTPTSEAIPLDFRGPIDSLVRSFMKDPKSCVQSLLQRVE